MKALTVSQPFASLIASGEKWIENRRWFTPYRGPIAIHAGKGTQYLDRIELEQYPHGCIIAIGELTACLLKTQADEYATTTQRHRTASGSSRTWREVAKHVHNEGPYLWILEGVTPIDPIPCSGAQGLWNWERPS